MPAKLGSLVFRSSELLSYLAGTVLTGFFIVQLAQGEVERQEGIAQFEQAAAAGPAPESLQEELASIGDPDTSLWAPGRIKDYEVSLTQELPEELIMLRDKARRTAKNNDSMDEAGVKFRPPSAWTNARYGRTGSRYDRGSRTKLTG